MQTRRTFLHSIAAASAKTTRKRRILWNDDGDDIRSVAFGLPHLWHPDNPAMVKLPARYSSVEEFLDFRLSALAGKQVDTLIYCGHFVSPVWEFPRDRIAALGPDPLQPVIDFAHKNAMEFFFSIRMNDTHSSFGHRGPEYRDAFRIANPHLLLSKTTQEEFDRIDLPWLRGDAVDHPLAGVLRRRGPASRDYQSWLAYNYALAETRARFLSIVNEACRRYDVEGIELDWLRHPFFFPDGQERAHIPVMNAFVRQVRNAINEHARRRGRPILLAVRVPDSPERALAVGLDPETWIADGCVDLLIAGNGNAPFSAPFHEWVAICSPHGVPVYACMDRMETVLARPAAIHAAAHRAWSKGVDGVSFFNHYVPGEYDNLRQAAGSHLPRANKLYRIDPDHTAKGNFTITPGQLPQHLSFASGSASLTLKIDIADDPKTAARVVLHTRWTPSLAPARVQCAVNGAPATLIPASVFPEPGWIDFGSRALRKGDNRIRFTVDDPRGNSARIDQALVSIEYDKR